MAGNEYVCTMDEATLKLAREELHEEPKERMSQVETFRTWILQQKHLTAPTEVLDDAESVADTFEVITCGYHRLTVTFNTKPVTLASTDTEYLLKYLRTAKFSQLRAREVLEGQLKAKYKFPEWLSDIDMADPKIQEFLGTGYMLPMPKRDSEGRLWAFLDLGAFEPNPKKWNKNVIIRAIFGLTYYLTLNESDLVNGLVFFEDITRYTPKMLTFWGMDTAKKTTKLWQGNFPGRFKQFHYYNVGPVFETLMTVCKPIMSKKWQDRMVLHGKNLEEVYKTIPKEMFPEQYLPDDYSGPSQGSSKQIIGDLLTELRSPAVRDRILYETSSKWKYDLKMKPEGVPSESFRRLNVE